MADGSRLQEGRFYVEITPEALDLPKYTSLVEDPSAGAIATFVGVTRNHFQGKTTEKLEYEAYGPMALKKLQVRLGGSAPAPPPESRRAAGSWCRPMPTSRPEVCT